MTPRLLLALLAWSMIAPAFAATDPLADCLERARQQGWEQVDLSRDCPAALAELKARGVDRLLANPMPRNPGPEQLAFFRQSLYPSAPSTRWRPDYAGLQALLDGLLVRNSDAAWEQWQAFLQWLKGLDLGQYSDTFKKLSGLLNSLTPSAETSKNVIYLLLAMIVLMAMLLVLRELYHAGVLRRYRHVSAKPSFTSVISDGHGARPTWQGALGLPPDRQAGALLSLVIDDLIRRNQLPDDPGRTNRELLTALRRREAGLAASFEAMLATVEPAIYGGLSLDAAGLERIRQSASDLLGRGLTD